MRILFVTPSLPYPADQGSKLRSLALIRAAAEHHQVDLVSFSNESARSQSIEEADRSNGSTGADEEIDELRRLCREIRVVPLPDSRGILRRSWAIFFDQLPDLAHRLESGAFATEMQELLQQTQYDVIQLEGLEMMPFLGVARGLGGRAAIIYDAHNAEMYLQRTMFQAEFRDVRRWHAGLYSMSQWSKLGTYERIMMNETDMVLAVSDIDVGKLRGRHVEPELVPNGVDTSAITYREPGDSHTGTMVFIGSLDYRPNADAVRWFARSILPLVRARIPTAKLRLVGKGSDRIQADGVEAVGYVDDLAAEIASADVAVIPMRMGSGVRFKALEAMAAGVPVVSTTLGISGIAADHERHALIADGPAPFADAVVRLLEDRSLARQLALYARRLVEGRYDWNRITPGYLRLLTTARRARRQTG